MKHGLALITISALLSVAPVAYAVTLPTSTTSTTSTTVSSTGTTGTGTYTVKPGDTLWKISQSTSVPIANIEEYNGIINPNSLEVGQVLKIPAIYTVKSGDTLWKIANTNGVTVQAIVQANSLTNADQLSVGQVLTIPGVSSGSTATGSTPSTYTVQAGDTLWKIAQAKGVTVQAIVQANSLTNADQLSVGQVLTIPGASSGSTATGSTPSTYTVQAGDTLWKIAQAKGVTVQALVQINQLTNADVLTVGQVLKIPIGVTSGTTTGATVGSVVVTTGGAPSPDASSAKVNQAVQLSVTVKDTQGNTMSVLPNQITYTITGANPGTNATNASINKATEQFTAIKPGIYNCVATVNGVQSQPLSIQVFGNPATLNVSVNPNLVTGSYTLVPVHFVVVDSMGQPIMWTPVTVTIDNSSIAGISTTDSGPISNLPSTVTVSSGGDGSGTVWLRAGSVSGSANLVVTCAGLKKSVAIVSTSGPSKITASVTNSTVVANTNFSDTVTVRAFNSDGSPAANFPLTAEYSTGLFKSSNSVVTTNSQGTSQFTIYENNTSTGIGSVGARTGQAADDVPVTVVPGVDATQSTSSLPSNFSLEQTYVVPVTVKNASGNPVLHLDQAAFDLHLSGVSGAYDARGDVSELGNGRYQITFTPGNGSTSNMYTVRNGNYLASLLVNGVQVGSPQLVSVTTASYPAETQPDSTPNIALTFPQKLIANSENSSMYAMQIKVTDANGNPVANQQVALSSSNTNIAVPTLTVVTTDAFGVAASAITPGFMAGTAAITAVSGTSTQTISVQSVAEPKSIILSSPTSTVVSNGGSVTVTAKVINADGSPASGIALGVQSVTQNANGSSSSSWMAPNSIVTDANGLATFQVTPSDFSSGNTLNVQVGDNNTLKSNILTFTEN